MNSAGKFVKSFFVANEGDVRAVSSSSAPDQHTTEKRFLAVRAVTKVGSAVANVAGYVKDKLRSELNDEQFGSALQKRALGVDPPIIEWVSFIEGEDGMPKYPCSDDPRFWVPWHSAFLRSSALEALIMNSTVFDYLERILELCCPYADVGDLVNLRRHPRAAFWSEGILLYASAIKEDWMCNALAYKREFSAKEAEHFRFAALTGEDMEEQCRAHTQACSHLDSVRQVLKLESVYVTNALAVKRGHFHSLRQKCSQRAYDSFRAADRAKVVLARLEYESRTQTDALDQRRQEVEEDQRRKNVDEQIQSLEELQKQLRMQIEDASVLLDKTRTEKTTLTKTITTLGAQYASLVQQTIGGIAETHDVGKTYGLVGQTGAPLSEEETLRALEATTKAMNQALPMVPDYTPLESHPLLDVDADGDLIEANLARLEAACRIVEGADAAAAEESRMRLIGEVNEDDEMPCARRVEEKEVLLQQAWDDSEQAFMKYSWEHPPHWTQWEYRRADVWYRMSSRAKVES
eukprot:GEMP01026529.1.p1 GENE.GEMP01026529.1~~GEMP01026529.1.p1  ORF type:complete len:520 (-),score=135.18 GEMP01026529.1:646-2205(-)